MSKIDMSKLEKLLGATITVVTDVPASTRDNKTSVYRMLFASIGPQSMRKLEYADKKTARIKYSIIRGHCTRNVVETDGYVVNLRGNAVVVSNTNK